MKLANPFSRFLFFITVMLFFSVSTFAQYGHHRYNRYNRGYYAYEHRPFISLGLRYRGFYNTPPYYAYPANRYPVPYIHFGPRFGLRMNVLPFGFSTIFIGSVPYYYREGVYYRNYPGGGYEVTASPLGAVVSKLPPGSRVTVIDGQKYYELGGTFYQEEISGDNRIHYRVTGTDGVLNTERSEPLSLSSNENRKENDPDAIGTITNQLPPDCKVFYLDQQKYFESGTGVYYKEILEGNTVRYQVAGNSSGIQ